MSENKTVLIVDDDADLGDMLKEILDREGYDARVARNGAAALDLLGSLEPLPRLLIVDVRMPVMDGNELYARLRSEPRYQGIATLITTCVPAEAPPGTIVMNKPLTIEKLVAAVSQCCS